MLDRFHRPRPIAWFFFIAALTTCLTLGTWQVKRLQWKQGIIAAVAAAKEAPPARALPKDSAALEALQFHPVSVRGRWVSDVEFHIAPRYFKDKFGYWLVQPLTLNDGRTLLVNRGWIPGKQKEASTRPQTRVRGAASITGLVRVGAERSYFTPSNQPEKNIWFGRDTQEMAAAAGLKNIVPAMLDQTGVQKMDHLPIPSDGVIRLRNDHLSYIVTWYGIALGIVIIFLVAHRRK